MRRRNLLAGLLLLPLGATAGLFWWLQKSGPSLKPWNLIKSNVKFWKSPEGKAMEHDPTFGVHLYNDLPRYDAPQPGIVTVLSVNMANSLGKQRYGNVVSYDPNNPEYAAILFDNLLKMVPDVRIINIHEGNPWVGTSSFRNFLFVSTIKYVMAYGLLSAYPGVTLQNTVSHYCPDLTYYLQDLLRVPDAGDCITEVEREFIRNQVIPALKKVGTFITNNQDAVDALIYGGTYGK